MNRRSHLIRHPGECRNLRLSVSRTGEIAAFAGMQKPIGISDSLRHNPYRAIHKKMELIQIGTTKNGKWSLHH
ncbi:hypothetical protein [Sphingopyxis sp. LK2115]|uniref:hypothetical protein n=1 Tax=Sphingopyxis sp. LK2115 TaxID=2744558 RepID=UPI0016611382|nr:hypothetical protein [Sphingopyxis sp. LK2115]